MYYKNKSFFVKLFVQIHCKSTNEQGDNFRRRKTWFAKWSIFEGINSAEIVVHETIEPSLQCFWYNRKKNHASEDEFTGVFKRKKINSHMRNKTKLTAQCSKFRSSTNNSSTSEEGKHFINGGHLLYMELFSFAI